MFGILNRSVILNIVLALALAGLMIYLTSLFLRFYTKHNESAYLPAITQQDFNRSYYLLDSLNFDIEVDSTYDPKYRPGQIISQLPRGGREVKYKRGVLLVYNQYIRPRVKLPNFLNLTLRSASILLKKNMLLIGDTVFKHDITKGIILEQWVNGVKMSPGADIPVGVRVSFVVSAGLGEPNIPMKLLIGMSYPKMMQYMLMNELNPKIIWSGLITDTNTAVVYMQNPMHINEYNQVNYVAAGEYIDLAVIQNASDSLLKLYSHVEIIPLPQEDINEYNNYDFSYIPSSKAKDDIIDLSNDIETEMDRELIEEKIERQLNDDPPRIHNEPEPAVPIGPSQPSEPEDQKPKAVLPKNN